MIQSVTATLRLDQPHGAAAPAAIGGGGAFVLPGIGDAGAMPGLAMPGAAMPGVAIPEAAIPGAAMTVAALTPGPVTAAIPGRQAAADTGNPLPPGAPADPGLPAVDKAAAGRTIRIPPAAFPVTASPRPAPMPIKGNGNAAPIGCGLVIGKPMKLDLPIAQGPGSPVAPALPIGPSQPSATATPAAVRMPATVTVPSIDPLPVGSSAHTLPPAGIAASPGDRFPEHTVPAAAVMPTPQVATPPQAVEQPPASTATAHTTPVVPAPAVSVQAAPSPGGAASSTVQPPKSDPSGGIVPTSHVMPPSKAPLPTATPTIPASALPRPLVAPPIAAGPIAEGPVDEPAPIEPTSVPPPRVAELFPDEPPIIYVDADVPLPILPERTTTATVVPPVKFARDDARAQPLPLRAAAEKTEAPTSAAPVSDEKDAIATSPPAMVSLTPVQQPMPVATAEPAPAPASAAAPASQVDFARTVGLPTDPQTAFVPAQSPMERQPFRPTPGSAGDVATTGMPPEPQTAPAPVATSSVAAPIVALTATVPVGGAVRPAAMPGGTLKPSIPTLQAAPVPPAGAIATTVAPSHRTTLDSAAALATPAAAPFTASAATPPGASIATAAPAAVATPVTTSAPVTTSVTTPVTTPVALGDGSSAQAERPLETPYAATPATPYTAQLPGSVGTTAAAGIVFEAAKLAAQRDELADRRPTIGGDIATGATGAVERFAVAATQAGNEPSLDMTDQRWPQAMVAHIAMLRDAAADAANATDTRIRLVPDALGTIDIGVRQDGDTVHVHFTAEQPQTRALLQEAQPRLAEAAEARGLKLGQSSVDAGGANAGQQQRQQQPHAAPPSTLRRAATPSTAAAQDAGDGRIA